MAAGTTRVVSVMSRQWDPTVQRAASGYSLSEAQQAGGASHLARHVLQLTPMYDVSEVLLAASFTAFHSRYLVVRAPTHTAGIW